MMIATLVELTGWLDLGVVGRVTIVLALGLVAMSLASRVRASVRHLVMVATFGTVLLLPLISSSAPGVTIQVPSIAAERVASPALLSAVAVFRSVWAVGASILLGLLVIDLRRLRVLRRGGLPWLAGGEFIRRLARASGVRRSVEVLLHEGLSAPLTCGVWRPTILLPIDANEWSSSDLERALVHELEHVRRGDWLSQLVARVVCACYWFHPLAWMAWTRLRLEAERACDDAVVERAGCTEYAEQLVSLARRISTSRRLSSLAMADRSDLSTRVRALLDGTQRRGRAGYGTVASVVSVAGLMLVLVASIRAITPTKALPVPAKQAPPATTGVSERTSTPEVAALDVGVRRVTRAKRSASPRQAFAASPVESTPAKPQTGTDAQETGTRIYRSAGVSANTEAAITHSSSASASATSSGSASSSSHNNSP